MTKLSSQSAIEKQNKKRTMLTYVVSLCFLFICIYFNLAVGSSKIHFHDVIDYFFTTHESRATFLIHNVRMPRMIGGLIIGGALALAGLLMQAMTRNPLASPQIFGVNAGASFVVVLVTVLVPSLGNFATPLAFLGAFLGGLTVYVLSGSTRQITPVKLALAGMAIHLFFSSLTQGIILLNEDSNDTVMFWLVGSLNGLKWTQLLAVVPWIIVAVVVTLMISRQLSIMELGDDIAKGLGQKTQLVRIIAGLLIVVLAGTSVSIVGPIGFIGLIVPHIVKHYVGQNYSVLIPLTFIIGADLLLLSDVLSRLITFPFESPVGIVTSFVGAIYFLLFTLKGVKRID
ncbi:iron ABC transporter permease [Staphylococcus lugdunensis]|mgnify:CR=1 FL=1|jgi:iron complex transport system permease protein|uniref:Probable heme-iron transport system permease protein IsdF n=1 Tax=Staphylococcus lugdunensis TaxID=28035 RepID=A0A292DJF6_STALU|nr:MULTISPECIES: iron ABC transporter permease [Staphylococcus]AMG62412.1 iron-siderophore ABC transporter permease [Staphylococcus lugdunensis]ARJ10942.1 iron-siderophore ABC transporter permease [Staphylococcus lugdunensis]ARJ13454.1 iron-siderophore ABC transporter permease [Staphylococcus lugdunensis]ARJ15799.1 iron-siderophore ABC transporter permease [Staphylococcus lugdunensis]ARJ26955.1 iron-siderophore ABC transporter permease [Staphylococcus lugdunensis]